MTARFANSTRKSEPRQPARGPAGTCNRAPKLESAGCHPCRNRVTALRVLRVARGMSTLPAAPPMILRALRGGGWRDSAGILTRLGMRPGRLRDATVVARSGLFDENYYLGRYPDVAASLIDPLIHYVLWGAFEGRQPHPLFDPTCYLAEYPDVARAEARTPEPLRVGWRGRGRNPSPHFDSQYHLAYGADVRESGVNPSCIS